MLSLFGPNLIIFQYPFDLSLSHGRYLVVVDYDLSADASRLA